MVVVQQMVLNYCHLVYQIDHHLSPYCRVIRVMHVHRLLGVMAIPTLIFQIETIVNSNSN